MKGFSPFNKGIAKEKSFEEEDKEVVKKPKPKTPDDDSVQMTKEQEEEHRKGVLEYNKNISKPMNETQKNKIKQQLSKMDKDDPEAKLLQDMLNLPKNQ